MSTLKVIVFLLIISATTIDGRPLGEPRQASMSSAYSGAYGLGNYLNPGFGLGIGNIQYGLGNNLYPLGNNWYQQGVQQYPYNYQYGYNTQQFPYGSNYGNPYGGIVYDPTLFGSSGAPINQLSGSPQVYVGQSYVPTYTEWLPLPGADRSGVQSPRNFMVPPRDGNFMGTHPALSPDKRVPIG